MVVNLSPEEEQTHLAEGEIGSIKGASVMGGISSEPPPRQIKKRYVPGTTVMIGLTQYTVSPGGALVRLDRKVTNMDSHNKSVQRRIKKGKY